MVILEDRVSLLVQLLNSLHRIKARIDLILDLIFVKMISNSKGLGIKIRTVLI